MRLLGSVALVLSLTLTGQVNADIFADATKAQTSEVTKNYFGVHLHRLVLHPNEKALTTSWPEIAVGSVRLWDAGTNWADIAPKAGVWDYSRMDTYVNTANRNGAGVLYTLGSTPRWASARPDEPCPYGYGCGAESVRMAHWEEYVRRVVQRYGDRIRAYELWNEPNFSDFARDVGQPGFYTGSVAQMVEMAKVARKTLTELSPDALLCSPGFVNGPDRLEKFLAEGGAKYVQAVCYHFYAEGSAHFVRQVSEVRAIMKRNGVAHLPLWNTETGVDTLQYNEPPSGIAARTRPDAVARLSQMLILGSAAGMERFYYYAWDNARSGMVSANGQKLFGYESLLKIQSWLIGARFSGCRSAGTLVICEANQAGKNFAFVWATSPTETYPPTFNHMKIVAVERLFETTALSSSSTTNRQKIVFDAVPIRFELMQ